MKAIVYSFKTGKESKCMLSYCLFFFFLGSLLSKSVQVCSQENRLEVEWKHFLLSTAFSNIFGLLIPSSE